MSPLAHMAITSFQLQLVRGVRDTIDEFSSLDLTEVDADERSYWQEQRELAKQSTITNCLEWFLDHAPTPSEQTQASRAWRQLEAAGYVERVESPFSTRTVQLRLTAAGRAAANDPDVESSVRAPKTRLLQFIADRCELAGEVEKTDLFVAYVRWCEAKNLTPVAMTLFEQQLLSSVPAIGRVRRMDGTRAFGQTIYTNVQLRTTAAS